MRKLFILSLFLGVMGSLWSQITEVDSLLKEIYALNADKPAGFEKQIALGFYKLGKISHSKGQAEQAFDLYQKSLDYADNGDYYQVRGLIRLGICHHFILQKEFKKALIEANIAKNAFLIAEDSAAAIVAKGYRGLIYYHQNNYQKAWPLLFNGVKTNNEKHFWEPAISTALILGKKEKALEIAEAIKNAQLKNSEKFSFQKIEETLSRREAFVGYFTGEENTYAYVLTKKRRELIKLGATDLIFQDFEKYERSFLKKKNEDQTHFDQKGCRKSFFKRSSQLYELLWTPIEGTGLITHKKLIIAPDSFLSRLPFETLIKDQEAKHFHNYSYLITNHSIRYYAIPVFALIADQPILFKNYQSYLRKSGPDNRHIALRKAQLKMIKSKADHANPWHWAAFRSISQ